MVHKKLTYLPLFLGKLILTIGLVFYLTIAVFSQQAKPGLGAPTQNADTTQNNFIHIRYADELRYFIVNADTIQKLIGNVELNQDTVFIFCDSSTILNSSEMVANGNFILQQGDSTTIFSDSSEYSSVTKIAELYSNVSMLKGRQKLFTEQLKYDVNTKIATYLTGATLTDDTTFLKSTRGYFHAKTDDIFFKDSVVIVNPDFTLRSDTLKFNARTKIVTFLAPTLIMQDSARIYTESGYYDINKKFAEFNKNPQYVKNDQKAWSEKMTYDGNIKEVVLIGQAHFEDSTSVANADVIRHNESTGVTILEGNAFFKDENRTLTGDTIFYDSKNETYSTRGRSHIVDGAQILDADQVDYLKDRDVGIATGKVVFQDTTEKMTVICDYAEHSKKSNYLKAFGGWDSLGRPARPLLIKVIDGDSLYISADTLLSYEPGSVFDSLMQKKQSPPEKIDSLAIVSRDSLPENIIDPFMLAGLEAMLEDDNEANEMELLETTNDSLNIDSTALTARPSKPINEIPLEIFDSEEINQNDLVPTDSSFVDPLIMFLPDSLNQTVDTTTVFPVEEKEAKDHRIILAYKDVRILKSDLQALCDSLSYSSVDSLFRLFIEPIIWSDTSQFTADHVRIQLANDAIDRIFMDENSFIVNSPDDVFFNQIKGRNSIAFFDSSELRRVRVIGNAESVYYALDDEDAYVGVNKTVCSEMKIIFGNNQIEGIVFYDQPSADLFPMKEADHDGLRLPGFSWQIDRRPETVADLIKLKKVVVRTPQVTEPEPEPKIEADELEIEKLRN